MTNTTEAAYPLVMFYRLKKYPPSTQGIYLGSGEWPGRDARLAAFESYAVGRPDLFSIVVEGRHNETHLIFDDKAPRPTLKELADELAFDQAVYDKSRRPRSEFDLIVVTLVKGDQHGTYGNSYWSQENETIHLLSCGFDWAQFRGVGMGRWSEWGGTFGEDTYSDVLEARMTCRCDDEEEVAFGMELPSLADLIVTLDSKQLQRLFEDR